MPTVAELVRPASGELVYNGASELYFASGNTIYTGNPPRQFSEASFEVRHLCSNRSRTFVAAAGDHDLIVYASDSKYITHSEQVDDIRQIAWHPLGVNDSCLVVLTPRFVVTYYFRKSGIITDRLDLEAEAGDSNSSTCIGYKESASGAITMSFGSSAEATGQLTLYLGTEDGDIFYYSPFVPKEFVETQLGVEELLSFAVAQDLQSQDQPQADGMERAMRRQLAWAQEVRNGIQTASELWQHGDRYETLQRPARPAPAAQGPAIFNPYPSALYDYDQLSLFVTSVGEVSIVVQILSSFANFYLSSEPAALMWTNTYVDIDRTLTLIKSIPLDSEVKAAQLVDTVVALHFSQKTLIFDLERLGDDLESLLTTPHQNITIPVHQIEKALVFDNGLGPTILSIESGQVWRWNAGTAGSNVRESLSQKPEISYQSLLGDACNSMLELLSSIKVRPQIPPAGLIANDSKGVRALGSLAAEYNEQLAKLYKSLSTGLRETEGQRSELSRQLEKVAQMRKIAQSLNSGQLVNALDHARERQAALAERIAKFTEKLSTLAFRQPAGERELKWYTEVRRLRDRLDGNGDGVGLQRRIKELESTIALCAGKRSDTAAPEVSALKRRLQHQELNLKALRTKLGELEA